MKEDLILDEITLPTQIIPIKQMEDNIKQNVTFGRRVVWE